MSIDKAIMLIALFIVKDMSSDSTSTVKQRANLKLIMQGIMGVFLGRALGWRFGFTVSM